MNPRPIVNVCFLLPEQLARRFDNLGITLLAEGLLQETPEITNSDDGTITIHSSEPSDDGLLEEIINIKSGQEPPEERLGRSPIRNGEIEFVSVSAGRDDLEEFIKREIVRFAPWIVRS